MHPEVPEYKDHVRASTNPSGFIISPYTIEDEKGNLVSSSLLIWVAQLDREGILIYSPDLLGETEELMKSFHNLRVELNNLKSDPESRENSSYRKSANSVTDPTPTLVEKSKSLQNKRSTIMVERRSKALPLTPSNS